MSPNLEDNSTRAEAAMIGETFGEALGRLRQERGLSVRALGELTGYGKSYIHNLEKGLRKPHDALAKRLDAALDAGQELVRISEAARGEDADVYRREVLRRILGAAGVLGLGGSALIEAENIATSSTLISEAVRRSLLIGLDADEDDWISTASDYGRVYVESTASELRQTLLTDLFLLDEAVRGNKSDAVRTELWRSISQLSSFLAMTLANLGDTGGSLRWYRTARISADRARDDRLRMWVRGREAIRTIYEGRPLSELVSVTDEALAIGADIACSGTAEVYSARAQGFARAGRSRDATEALKDVERVFESLPPNVTGDAVTLYGWPEHRLQFIQSHVYSYTGRLNEAQQVQDAALGSYPLAFQRRRAQLLLHRSAGFARVGDIDGAVDCAYTAVDSLPQEHRFHVILEVARDVPRIASAAGISATHVAELDEYLATAGAPRRIS